MPEADRSQAIGQAFTGEFIRKGSEITVGDASFPYHRVYSASDAEEDLETSRKKLLQQIEDYFDLVAETLYEHPDLQEEMLKRLQNAKDLLQNMEDDPEGDLSQAQFEVRRVHVAIAKEQKIERGEKRLSWIVPALVVLYIAAIVLTVVLGGSAWTVYTQVPIVGIPVSVLTWSAVGSLGAILYRFYTRRRGRVSREIRWLIARPIIGIIMGGLSYLAVESGLIIFGTAAGSESDIPSTRPQLLWLLAFLSGFSDRIYKAVVDVVAGRITRMNEEEPTEGDGSE